MIKPEEITLTTFSEIYSAVRHAALDLDFLDDDVDDGILGPTEAIAELKRIYAAIKKAFGE